MSTENSATITTKKDFKNTPEGKYKYWAEELKTSIKAREKWWKKADTIVNVFLGESSQNKNTGDSSGGFGIVAG